MIKETIELLAMFKTQWEDYTVLVKKFTIGYENCIKVEYVVGSTWDVDHVEEKGLTCGRYFKTLKAAEELFESRFKCERVID